LRFSNASSDIYIAKETGGIIAQQRSQIPAFSPGLEVEKGKLKQAVSINDAF
jgi:hypothetical protein